MLTAAKNQIKVSLLSVKYGIIKEMLNKTTFIMNVVFMILNNASFIIQWLILFSLRENFGGYEFKDVLLLWGFAAGTYGISRFFFKSAFDLPIIINTGKLDSYLVQPKNVLISSITSKIAPSALGDIIYAYIVLIIYGITPLNFILFTILMITGGIILVALTIIFGSLSFWFSKTDLLAESIDSMATNFATYPDTIFTGWIKALFYCIIPIGFTAYMPVKLLGDFNIYNLIIIIGVVLIFVGLAFIIFYKGLRKYSSSNLMSARI